MSEDIKKEDMEKTDVTEEVDAATADTAEEVDTEAVVKEVLSGENLAEPSGIGKEKEALANLVFDKEDEDKDGKAKAGLKIFGVISILLAVAGLALIGLCFYFLMFAPTYDKSADYNGSVSYEQIASVTDPYYSEQKQPLEMISTSLDATPLDATPLDATETDAEESSEE